MTLGFQGADVVLQPENYLFQLGPYWPGVYVLGVYDSFGRGTVFGAIALSNQLIIFDRENGRVGFRCGMGVRGRVGVEKSGITTDAGVLGSTTESCADVVVLRFVPLALQVWV